MPNPTLKEIPISDYEKVIEVTDPSVNLHGYIAIHNTNLGPSLGGIRIFPYATKEEALSDVLRLAKGMTYKSAIVENGLGGGKATIIGDPQKINKQELFNSFGNAMNQLNGAYIGAEDLGSSPADMIILNKFTPYLVGLPLLGSSGDPAVFTAWGVFRGIEAVCKTLWNNPSVEGKTIALQGVGAVGKTLAAHLFWHGAQLIISDIDSSRVKEIATAYKAQIVSPDEILKIPCDILVPCARGGVINPQTIPHFKCKAIAGATNNQLSHSDCGKDLMQRNILYAPDYVINAGGLINVSVELSEHGYHPQIARKNVSGIYDFLLTIFQMSQQQGRPPSEVADQLAEYKIKYGVGKRTQPLNFQKNK